MGGSHSTEIVGPVISKYVLADELLNLCELIDRNENEIQAKKAQLESKEISCVDIAVPKISVEVSSNPGKLEAALRNKYKLCENQI